MLYLDTNILVYASINQDEQKRENSINIIEKAVKNTTLTLSTLTLQEYIFTLSKLKVDRNIINHDIQFYSKFATISYDLDILLKSMDVCKKMDSCKSINDIIHLELAKTLDAKLYTYDKGFNKFKNLYDIKIL